jgi:hypothetical protein
MEQLHGPKRANPTVYRAVDDRRKDVHPQRQEESIEPPGDGYALEDAPARHMPDARPSGFDGGCDHACPTAEGRADHEGQRRALRERRVSYP